MKMLIVISLFGILCFCPSGQEEISNSKIDLGLTYESVISMDTEADSVVSTEWSVY